MGQLLWNLENPRRKAKGTLVDVAVKTKVPKFPLIVVPAIDDHAVAILTDQMRQSIEVQSSKTINANQSWCNVYKQCFYKYGACTGLSKVIK